MPNAQANCPSCGSAMDIPDGSVNDERLTCPECGNAAIVAMTDEGPQLSEAPDVGEDWGE